MKTSFNESLLDSPTPEFAYILGLIWSDGYLTVRKRQNSNSIHIEILKSDADCLKNNFLKTGVWATYDRKRENRQRTTTLFISNFKLRKYLEDNDYLCKKIASADKILSKIGKQNEKYWLLGLLDGDGCISNTIQTMGKRTGNNWQGFSLAFYSSLNQDWSFLEKICRDANIKYKTTKRIRATGSGSQFDVVGRMGHKLCEYIYSDVRNIEFLNRKKKRFDNYSRYILDKSLKSV